MTYSIVVRGITTSATAAAKIRAENQLQIGIEEECRQNKVYVIYEGKTGSIQTNDGIKLEEVKDFKYLGA